MTDLARDIEKAARRAARVRRNLSETMPPQSTLDQHESDLRKKLGKFFDRIRPQIVGALAKGAKQ